MTSNLRYAIATLLLAYGSFASATEIGSLPSSDTPYFQFGEATASGNTRDQADSGLDSIIGIVFEVAESLIFGDNVDSWREENLRARGYELVDTVTASNPEGAMTHFRAGKK
jgi:hypothetical protein